MMIIVKCCFGLIVKLINVSYLNLTVWNDSHVELWLTSPTLLYHFYPSKTTFLFNSVCSSNYWYILCDILNWVGVNMAHTSVHRIYLSMSFKLTLTLKVALQDMEIYSKWAKRRKCSHNQMDDKSTSTNEQVVCWL